MTQGVPKRKNLVRQQLLSHEGEGELHSAHAILGWETPYMDVSTTLHRHYCRGIV